MGPYITSISISSPMNHPDPWYIAGIGAIGTLLATLLSQTSELILLLKNKQSLASYEASPLSIRRGNYTLTAHPQALPIDALETTKIQRLICTAKARDVLPILKQLVDYLDNSSTIILIHNGVGVLEEIKNQLPELRIISCITNMGAYLEAPFTVGDYFEGILHLGSTIGEAVALDLKAIDNLFMSSQLSYQWEESIQPLIWEKFALNCSINALTALFACKNGELRAHVNLLEQLTREIENVLKAHDVTVDHLFEKTLKLTSATANNYSSMHQDIHGHKSTELHYLNEHLRHLALAKNIPTPVNDQLLSELYEKYPYLVLSR